LGAPAIPIDGMNYNSTDGFFCVTSVLTQLSAYFGTNITVPYITGAVNGDNSTAVDLVTSIQPNIICNDCFFATFDILEQAFPGLDSTTFDAIFSIFNMSSPLPEGTTLAEFANGTCEEQGLAVSSGMCFYVPGCTLTDFQTVPTQRASLYRLSTLPSPLPLK